MKKHLFLGIMGSALFFNSCSSNDDNEGTNLPSEQPQLLLSKVTTVYYDNPSNPETTVSTLSYNNQKQLIKTISEGRTSTFEYDNTGKPAKTIYYNPDGTVDYYSAYTYNGDQLTSIKAIYADSDGNRTVTYTYNTNGQMTSSTLCQDPECSHPATDTYIYNGNNISSETSTWGGSMTYSNKRDFSYDDKFNPYTNINKYLKIMMGGAYSLSKNNYLVEKISYKDNGVWQQNQTITYTIQYNSSGFPVQVVGKEANGNPYVQYNYEYIIQ
ncbi:hypothetical protein BBH99_14905 [Chryseobacterium contaminans]|uniref:YD repeat-containing protein n=1 Tax=Chryseobacterium contaminans TaxID=1423959 RepID=A0A1M6ZSV5_9FLAO|nr:hypothetical protein [Chryseobacterium contaminans]OCA69191.1 hypothetical protein BBH99_14905 [Chryseobacterium contaminans]SHL33499.1 YD repeat-containing protein [Chryseobacterium contaminans]